MSDWIEHKTKHNPFSFEVAVNLKCKHAESGAVLDIFHRNSSSILWNNQSRRGYKITHYQRCNPLEIGDIVKVVNDDLDTHGSEGRIININKGIVSVKLRANFVVRPLFRVLFRLCQLF